MYRTHKALPSSNKVSSLYVFDAVARAMKQASKSKSIKTEAGQGTPTTFLLKLEGVLDGLFNDLSAVSDIPELKVSYGLCFPML